MGFWSSVRTETSRRSSSSPLSDFWYTPEGFLVGGAGVGPELALTLAPVWKGIRKLSGGIASFQAKVYERLARGGRPAPRHALSWALGRQPNPWMTGFDLWETAMVHMILRGQMFAFTRIGPKPYPGLEGRYGLQLDPIHPDRVRVFLRPNRMTDYRIRDDNGQEHSYGSQDVLHLRGMSTDGINGLVMVQYAAGNIRGMLAAENYAQRFFKQGATAAIAAVPDRNIGPEGVENLTKSVRSYLVGLENAHSVFVPPDKVTLQTLGVDPEKAQLLLTRQLTSEQVEQWLDMPAGTIATSEKAATYASAYQRSEDLVLQCFRPWVERIEAKVDVDILQHADDDPLRYYLKFEMDSMLRGNAKERAEIHRIEIESGYGTRNEARLDEDREPLPGLDDPILALNMGRGASQGPSSPTRGTLDRATLVTLQEATRLVRKEVTAATKAAAKFASDGAGWQAWLREFYAGHAGEVAERLRMPMPAAQEYASRQGLRLAERGIVTCGDWEWTVAVELAELALDPRVESAAAQAAA